MRNCMLVLGLSVCLSASAAWAQTLSDPLFPQSTPSRSQAGARKLWLASLAAMSAAHAFDAYSSWGYQERNGLLRAPSGTFSSRGVEVKMAIAGATVLVQWLILRHRPQAARTFAGINFAIAGVESGVAARNCAIKNQ